MGQGNWGSFPPAWACCIGGKVALRPGKEIRQQRNIGVGGQKHAPEQEGRAAGGGTDKSATRAPSKRESVLWGGRC